MKNVRFFTSKMRGIILNSLISLLMSFCELTILLEFSMHRLFLLKLFIYFVSININNERFQLLADISFFDIMLFFLLGIFNVFRVNIYQPTYSLFDLIGFSMPLTTLLNILCFEIIDIISVAKNKRSVDI